MRNSTTNFVPAPTPRRRYLTLIRALDRLSSEGLITRGIHDETRRKLEGLYARWRQEFRAELSAKREARSIQDRVARQARARIREELAA